MSRLLASLLRRAADRLDPPASAHVFSIQGVSSTSAAGSYSYKTNTGGGNG